MTREEAKELLPIIQAFAEGKTIQSKQINASDKEWRDIEECNCLREHSYRIKPKYRPFRTREECWNEMIKHQPFGWIEIRVTRLYTQIIAIDKTDVVIPNSTVKFDMAFEDFKFKDGAPFGIKEE